MKVKLSMGKSNKMSDPIRDELHRECEEIKKMVYEFLYDFTYKEPTPMQLVRDFGLTVNEAKSWLENEPNFNPNILDQSIRRFFTDPSNRRRLYRTLDNALHPQEHARS